MLRILLLALCTAATLHSMDTQSPDPFKSLPQETLYTIIDKWPALNVYRLISKQWHALTSYEHADEIIAKLGSKSLGHWDAEKLFFQYMRKVKIDTVSILLNRNQFEGIEDFTINPYAAAKSKEMRSLLVQKLAKENDPTPEVLKKDENDILYEAAFHGNVELVKEYIKEDRNIGDHLTIALFLAVSNDQIEIVNLLLTKVVRSYGSTAYYVTAAESAHIDTIKRLCKQNTQHINDQDSRNVSPFMLAIVRGRLEVAKKLKKYDATFQVRDGMANSPLYDACLKGRGETVEFLLANGVKPDSFCTINNTCLTPLLAAVSENHLEIAQKLIDAGANVNYDTQGQSCSPTPLLPPLIQAAYKGHLKMIQLLVKAGAWIWASQFKGKNARDIAHAQEHNHIVEWFDTYGFKA